VTYHGFVSREGVAQLLRPSTRRWYFGDVEKSLSNITGRQIELHLGESSDPSAGWICLGEEPPNLAGRANDKVADVARARGADGASIRAMGLCAEKTMKELAQRRLTTSLRQRRPGRLFRKPSD
jgi:hypothetical protein